MDKILYEKIRYKIIERFHWMIFYRIKDTNSYKVNRASLDKYNSNVALPLIWRNMTNFFYAIEYLLYIHIYYIYFKIC